MNEPHTKPHPTFSRASGVSGYLAKVYSYMTLGLGLTGAVSFLFSSVPALSSFLFSSPIIWFIAMFLPLGVILYINSQGGSLALSPQKAQTWFWIFSASMGLSLTPVFLAYTGQSLLQVFLITACCFGSLSFYGFTTKRDLSVWGSFLLMGVVGLVVTSLVGLFIKSSALNMAISMVGVVIFAGFTAYDTYHIKMLYFRLPPNSSLQEGAAVFGALSLYTDFINLFLSLLRIFGDRK